MSHTDPLAALAAANDWHKATYSQGQESGCVEIGSVPGLVGVRDTKLGSTSPILTFTTKAWLIFLGIATTDAANNI